MLLSELLGRRIGLLGFGVEGRSVAGALARAGHAEPLTVFVDRAPQDAPREARLDWAIGPPGIERLADREVLIRSPGFKPDHPTLRAARERTLTLTTATNIFIHELRAAGKAVVGITGSKGKSTTSTLAHRTLAEAGVRTTLVGNIGTPALDRLQHAAEWDVAVLELSSYQCADLTLGPDVAVLLDLFPEHMDWHGSVAAYYAAKLCIATAQRPGDTFLYTEASRARWPIAVEHSNARAINQAGDLHFADGWFRRGETRLFRDDRMALPGLHNRRNACAALAAAERFGADHTHLERVLADFRGLPHRLEDLGSRAGISWCNDAISTAPEATAAALEALGARVATLIAGGTDRGYDFDAMARAIEASATQTVILTGDTADEIRHSLGRQNDGRGARARVIDAPDLESAVALAATVTPKGRACLFSPGSPSYGVFRNFEERGAVFRGAVAALVGD